MIVRLNKSRFLKEFLSPISRVSGECIIHLTENSIYSWAQNFQDGTYVYGEITGPTNVDAGKDININIKDIRKFMKILECITLEDFELEIDDNCSVIRYKTPELSFKMHLVTDSVIQRVTASLDKINRLVYNTTISLKDEKISEVLRGSAIANETKKLYIYTKDKKVFAELTDKSTQNVDSITFIIADSFQGEEITKELPFCLEFVKVVSASISEEVVLKINNSQGIIRFDISGDNTALKFIKSAFTK